MGVLTQEPRGCPHPGAEGVSSPRSREGVLTQESRRCSHPRAYWVSSPKSACRKFGLLKSKPCQGHLAAQGEEVVILHLPLRGHCRTSPGCRTSYQLSHAHPLFIYTNSHVIATFASAFWSHDSHPIRALKYHHSAIVARRHIWLTAWKCDKRFPWGCVWLANNNVWLAAWV